MIILLDLEWYENEKRLTTLTQLAAARVNDRFELIDTFDSLVCPDTEVDHYCHIGFSGASREDYLSAPTLEYVLSDFLSWLTEADELYFWHESSAILLRSYLPGLPNKMKILQKCVWKSLPNGEKAKGDVYEIAKRCGISRIYPKHCAKNDVAMLLCLLVYIGRPIDELSDDVDSIINTSKVSRRKMREQGRMASLLLGKEINPIDGYRFVYNPKEKLLHRVDCPALIWEKDCRCFATLQGAVRKYRRGCMCCKNILLEYFNLRKFLL